MSSALKKNEKKSKARRYHHGDLRAALIDATRELVELNGPEGFSVADACRAAGVSTAAPYRHFSDKEAMLAAVARDGLLRLASEARTASEHQELGSVDAITSIGAAYVRFAVREPGVFQIMFGMSGRGEHKPEIMEAGMNCYGVLLRQIAARLPKGTDEEAIKARGLPLWTFVHGLSYLMLEGKIDSMGLDVELEGYIRENSRRLLAD